MTAQHAHAVSGPDGPRTGGAGPSGGAPATATAPAARPIAAAPVPECAGASPRLKPLFRLAQRVAQRWNDLRTRQAQRGDYVAQVVAYRGYGSTRRVRVLGRVMYSRPGLHGESDAFNNFRGWVSFTSVPIQHAEVTVEIGVTRAVVHADAGGVVDALVDVELEPGWHEVRMSADGAEPDVAQVLVVEPGAGFGIVSDIDDTVMVTALPRPFLALWNTFVLSERARTPTPGMAVLLDRLATEHPEAPVVYLSTGPWNAAPTLQRFLGRNLYPAGPLLLTDWGMTPERWFRSGRDHKRENLERLAAEFPGIRWLLVGDNGQHDESIYAEFAAEHPDSVAAVAIRELSASQAVFSGGTTHDAAGGASRPGLTWASAPDGAGLAQQLESAGVL
ncbi:App1 family protein [Sinomonas atrocyanea]|uniref:App1 family protein n=1 Tax=Sinomonas atrocyanea TaxID=37927 RepID=UPI002787C5B1|nr:phosphatase domain-containing protein [Sinomonas atrocyanea]MDQ0260131.1 phosphatidate phosphatase APP1 [Sinomonas atrocyanea]MDR6620193.1 phosphatidate phosphatase APP1 [Sinomonas atrocyanea]